MKIVSKFTYTHTHTHTHTRTHTHARAHTHTKIVSKFLVSSGEQRPSKAKMMWQVLNLVALLVQSTNTDAKGAARLSEMHSIAVSSIGNYAMTPQGL